MLPLIFNIRVVRLGTTPTEETWASTAPAALILSNTTPAEETWAAAAPAALILSITEPAEGVWETVQPGNSIINAAQAPQPIFGGNNPGPFYDIEDVPPGLLRKRRGVDFKPFRVDFTLETYEPKRIVKVAGQAMSETTAKSLAFTFALGLGIGVGVGLGVYLATRKKR